MKEKKPEIQKDDILEVTIQDMGNEGEGIGKANGFTLFVKDAVIGDVARVKIMKVKKSYAYARLEKVLAPSPFRVTPKCAFARQCGGCQLQPLAYEKQLEYKQNQIRNNLIRIGGFAPETIDAVMEPIVGMDDPYHYRNKAQFPVGYDREGNLITGFYAGRSHQIIANTDCALGAPENEAILKSVLHFMSEHQITAYDETSRQGLVRHILIRKAFATGQLMVCLIINGRKLPASDKLVEALGSMKNMTSVSLNFNTERTNVILGQEGMLLWGEPFIEDSIRVLKVRRPDAAKQAASCDALNCDEFQESGQSVAFRISPQSFYQVNPLQTEKLYSLALSYAGLTGEETVWDLYCGIGTISLFLARRAKQVYGVEIVPQAIEDARANARLNGITNAQFFVGKAEEVLPREYEANAVHADVIVVDPPRKGCDGKCLATILKMQPERVIYVSCDSATLARDLKVLCASGYRIERGRGVDQFGNTVHVETIVGLQRRDT